MNAAQGAAEVPRAGAPQALWFRAGDLRRARQMTARWAAAAGLADGRGDDFVIAVNEIATNAVLHGSPQAWLLLQVSSDGAAEAEVRDTGRWRPAPVGPAPADGRGPLGGMGIPLARQVCDDVEIRAEPGGTSVTLRMNLWPPRPGGQAGRRLS